MLKMKPNDSIPRAARIAGTAAFIEHVGIQQAAEFIVDLQDSVDGLGRNNAALSAALRIMPSLITGDEPCAQRTLPS
jgi:hypothetical protein